MSRSRPVNEYLPTVCAKPSGSTRRAVTTHSQNTIVVLRTWCWRSDLLSRR